MGEDIILCQITSKKLRKDKYSIELKHDQTRGGSLQIDSYIRANMIFTASTTQILKRVCSITDEKYAEVELAIHNIVDL